MRSQNQLKDVNSVRQTILLNNFVRMFPVFAILGLLISGIQGLLIAVAVSLAASFCAEFFSSIIGSSAVSTLYGSGRRTSTLREQLECDLSQVRFKKMNQNYEIALTKVNSILSRDPKHLEALLLKAQLLWDGYKDYTAARECLVQITRIEPNKNAAFNRWAFNFYRTINKQISSSSDNKLCS